MFNMMAVGFFQWNHGASRRNGQAGFNIWFPYDEGTVRRLKEMVPAWGREWHEDNKGWWIHRDFAQAVEDLFPGFLVGVNAGQPLPGFDPREEPPDDDWYWNQW